MLYSIVPLEAVLAEEKPPACEWIADQGRFLAIEQREDKQVISRVVSTDLRDYLNPALSPGAVRQEKSGF